ncbi:hypothetical protein BDW75DRAFT_222554 [Aspergillus navahoensis]
MTAFAHCNFCILVGPLFARLSTQQASSPACFCKGKLSESGCPPNLLTTVDQRDRPDDLSPHAVSLSPKATISGLMTSRAIQRDVTIRPNFICK